MSDVTKCLICGATCRILGQDAEGLPKLKAFQNTDAEKKIEQLKQSLHHLQETLRTERETAKAKIIDLEAQLSSLQETMGLPVSEEESSHSR